MPTILYFLKQRIPEQIVDNIPSFRMVVVELLEVFKAFSLDIWSRPLTFQLRVVVSGVLKVFSQNRVQHRCLVLRNAFLGGMWSRSLFLVVLVKAFEIFSQDRVHPLLLTIQLVLLKLWMSLGKGVFALFPKLKKVRNWVRTRVRECIPVSPHPRQLLITVLVSGSGSWSSRIRGLITGTAALGRHAGRWRLGTRLPGV